MNIYNIYGGEISKTKKPLHCCKGFLIKLLLLGFSISQRCIGINFSPNCIHKKNPKLSYRISFLLPLLGSNQGPSD